MMIDLINEHKTKCGKPPAIRRALSKPIVRTEKYWNGYSQFTQFYFFSRALMNKFTATLDDPSGDLTHRILTILVTYPEYQDMSFLHCIRFFYTLDSTVYVRARTFAQNEGIQRIRTHPCMNRWILNAFLSFVTTSQSPMIGWSLINVDVGECDKAWNATGEIIKSVLLKQLQLTMHRRIALMFGGRKKFSLACFLSCTVFYASRKLYDQHLCYP